MSSMAEFAGGQSADTKLSKDNTASGTMPTLTSQINVTGAHQIYARQTDPLAGLGESVNEAVYDFDTHPGLEKPFVKQQELRS